ncbi:hypothetical protein [Bosea sp. 124]|uniref:DUF6894 family protein n=1 Tax=Bosea sp. 124 TaxID=2135642 RepID=UPI000D37C796|nr:hypothetical protein [Bosea sp. 124]PTM40635.1 hypothetical protein C8D03_2164 [Bosea sp. 124]
MPRYFIDSSDGNFSHIDAEGVELAGDAAARYLALDALPDMVREVLPDGDKREFAVCVRDEFGKVIYSASLTLAGAWRESGRRESDEGPALDL